MANTFKFGNGNWAVKDGSVLAYNDENNNFKPLPFDFTRDSIATRVNRDGLIEVVPNNMPRIDFLDNTSGHLLLEPSRTNLITYSEDFSNSSWVGFNTTVTTNTTISPDGSQTADEIESTDSSHLIYFQSTVTQSTTYTFSFFLKSGTKSSVRIAFYDDTANSFINQDAAQSYVDYGNGWKRIVATVTTPSGCTLLNSYIDRSSGIGTFYAWGAQLETGSYATSYIPTKGSTVTRAAETCNGSGNDSLFSEAEGVLYVESEALANDETSRVVASISNGSTTINRVVLQYTNASGGNEVVAFAQASSAYSSVLTRSITNALTFNKFAIVYDDVTNNFDLWLNGTKIGDGSLSSSFTTNTLTTIQLADGNGTSNPFYGRIKEIKVYSTALTDTELEKLTS